MNKICTSKEQSQKLIDLGIDVITADMDYIPFANSPKEYDCVVNMWNNTHEFDWIPAWSLSALFNYLREIDFFPEIDADELTVTMSINYVNDYEAKRLTPLQTITVKAENFIDACYELILKLHD